MDEQFACVTDFSCDAESYWQSDINEMNMCVIAGTLIVSVHINRIVPPAEMPRSMATTCQLPPTSGLCCPE